MIVLSLHLAMFEWIWVAAWIGCMSRKKRRGRSKGRGKDISRVRM